MDAQPTAWTASGRSRRRRLTWDTSTVMPRSLKEPVWLLPHCLTHRSRMPSASRPRRSAQNRLLLPSNMLTMSSSPSCCDRAPTRSDQHAHVVVVAQLLRARAPTRSDQHAHDVVVAQLLRARAARSGRARGVRGARREARPPPWGLCSCKSAAAVPGVRAGAAGAGRFESAARAPTHWDRASATSGRGRGARGQAVGRRRLLPQQRPVRTARGPRRAGQGRPRACARPARGARGAPAAPTPSSTTRPSRTASSCGRRGCRTARASTRGRRLRAPPCRAPRPAARRRASGTRPRPASRPRPTRGPRPARPPRTARTAR